MFATDLWTPFGFHIFKAHSQICEKRPLASTCLCVRLHGTTRVPLDEFSLNLIVFFGNMSRNFKFHWNRARIIGRLHEDQYTFLIISCSNFLRIKKFETKFVDKMHVQSKIFPPKSYHLWDNVEKYRTAWQATDENMAHAHYMLDT